MSILIAPLIPFLVSHLEARQNLFAFAQPETPPTHVETTIEPTPAITPTPPIILAKAPAPAPQPAPQTPPLVSQDTLEFDRDAIIDRAGQALATTKTARGRFTQQDSYGRASGQFYISRPGKVRFDYERPEQMHIISDGVSVGIEEPERDAFDAVPLASTPLNLFLKTNLDLKKDGNVVDVSASDVSYFLTLEDRTGEADGSMVLEFRASDFELMGWRAIDGTGAQTFVQLIDTQTNVQLRPAMFIVKDPADAYDDRR